MCPQPRAKPAELLSFLRLLWHAVGLPRMGSSRAFVHDDAVAPTRESASGPFGRTRRRSRQLLGLAQLLLRLVHALLDLATTDWSCLAACWTLVSSTMPQMKQAMLNRDRIVMSDRRARGRHSL
jgi:hypothetical protein